MDLFERNRSLSADYIAAPVEPSGAELVAPRARQFSTGDVVSLIDGHLADQSGLLPDDRNTELIDVLLGLRNVLTAPVIPRRTS